MPPAELDVLDQPFFLEPRHRLFGADLPVAK
jgi:hypothetical protein